MWRPIIAQSSSGYSEGSVLQWLHKLVPFDQIVSIVNQIMPAFVLVGAMFIAIGGMISMIRVTDGQIWAPTLKMILLMAAMACFLWWLGIAESIVNGLVQTIGAVAPSLNWLIVNNPSDTAMALNFAQPFAKLGAFIAGNFQNGNFGWWEIDKWGDYLMRMVFIILIGFVAGITVFIMEGMLIIQKLIIIGSRPLTPVFIGLLNLDSTKSQAFNFLKTVLAVMAWPIGWALVHVGTMAALQNLQPPSWNSSLGDLVAAFVTLFLICLWMIIGTISAPRLIAWAVTSGGNFAAGLIGGATSAAGQHVTNAMSSGGTVAGGFLGASFGGPTGAKLGSQIGGNIGSGAGAPFSAITQSAEGATGNKHAVPNSRSAALADLAVKNLSKGSS